MATITADMVKQLRDKTGAGMMECKAALAEANGNAEDAVTLLRKRGLAQAAKRAGRATAQGTIGSYIHMGGRIGVLVEVNCESDFVARTDDFNNLVKEIAMQVAAADPKWVRREDVPGEAIDKEKSIYRAQMESSGKPANVIDKSAGSKLSILRALARPAHSCSQSDVASFPAGVLTPTPVTTTRGRPRWSRSLMLRRRLCSARGRRPVRRS